MSIIEIYHNSEVEQQQHSHRACDKNGEPSAENRKDDGISKYAVYNKSDVCEFRVTTSLGTLQVEAIISSNFQHFT